MFSSEAEEFQDDMSMFETEYCNDTVEIWRSLDQSIYM